MLLTLGVVAVCGFAVRGESAEARADWSEEVIYHVMPRSFYDSNGDLHGDLNGFTSKLDYLKELGVTAILFTPIVESGYYHNYFPTDYEKIDPEYGTKEDYLRFVRAVHSKGMKFIMDMETQYAQSGHRWFDDSYRNPDSKYSDFIYYSDPENRYPEQFLIPSRSPLYGFKGWPDKEFNIVHLDLNHPRVKRWMSDYYLYWLDPNGDGKFDDGVDGYRLDHIMDDLDNKGIFTNMYREFWRPILERSRKRNPKLFVVGEQSDWNVYGDRMVRESGASAAFNFRLKFAIVGKNDTHGQSKQMQRLTAKPSAALLHAVVKENLARFRNGQTFINFIENHDTNRFASVVKEDEARVKMGAVLYMLLPGVPSVYYGQELGVTGVAGDWKFDANHLPLREAFPWTEDYRSKGTAVFYKETGEWWDNSFHLKPSVKKFALENQRRDPGSIWNHYKSVIALRKRSKAFTRGEYLPVDTGNDGVYAFRRRLGASEFLVVVNLTGRNVGEIRIPGRWESPVIASKGGSTNRLGPYGFMVLPNTKSPKGE